jgi:hypothetical protein
MFNPREQTWGDHFRIAPDDGRIHGLTPTGRVTVDRLDMNSTAQLLARRSWMRLGIFP